MMESILSENLVSFKELEQKIFEFVCELGREITKSILEGYDDDLAKNRDRTIYRDKGKRGTTIKTVYGEVTYSRRIYQTKTEEGETAYIYLLDDAMHMDKIGLISTNLAEKIVMTATETPYRATADSISSTSGQSISHGGAWNLIQQLGERISKEEDEMVRQMETEETEGKEEIPALFEEMDGVWLKIQGEGHKKACGQELKVFTMYEGWDQEDHLVKKELLAGMEESERFHEKREALIEKRYDKDEIGQRILNGDGGSWINEAYDQDAIIQLDRFHVHQEIRRCIKDKRAKQAITELYIEQKIDEMLEYIQTYANSVESNDPKDTRSREAKKLYMYLYNNREILPTYQNRGIAIPAPRKGIIYKKMGVQESENCTVITMRMKHRRMRWSVSGANNMAKTLYRKENHELAETIERLTDGMIYNVPIKEVIAGLSAAKAPKADGKGSSYPDRISCHMPLRDTIQTASIRTMLNIFE